MNDMLSDLQAATGPIQASPAGGSPSSLSSPAGKAKQRRRKAGEIERLRGFAVSFTRNDLKRPAEELLELGQRKRFAPEWMTAEDPYAKERDRTAGLVDVDGRCNFERCVISGVETSGDVAGSSVLGLTSFSVSEQKRMEREEKRPGREEKRPRPVSVASIPSSGCLSQSDTESDGCAKAPRIRELEEEVRRLKAETHKLRDALHHSPGSSMDCLTPGSKKIVSFKTQINELQTRNVEMGKRMTTLEGEKAELESSVAGLGVALSELRGKRPLPSVPKLPSQDPARVLEGERAEWERERSVAKERVGRLEAEVAKSRAFYEKELLEKLTAVRKRGEFERANVELQRERAEHIATLHLRDKEIWALDFKVHHLEVQNEELVAATVRNVARMVGV